MCNEDWIGLDDITYETALNMTRKICTSTPSDVEDVANDAYFEYLRGDKRGKPILYRRIIDALRRIHGHKDASGSPVKLKRQQGIITLDESIISNPKMITKDDIAYIDIQEWIDSTFTNPRTKFILEMRINGYTLEEIADIINSSGTYVCVAFKEIKRVAKIALEKEGIDIGMFEKGNKDHEE